MTEDQYTRIPLTLKLFPHFSLQAPRLPAPLHLAVALLTAQGLTLADRWAAIRFAQALKGPLPPPAQTVTALLEQHRQPPAVVRNLWGPLCISALNTPLSSASARVFATVVRDTLFHSRADSDLILPRVDLTALFPEPAARWLVARGSDVRCGSRVTGIEPAPSGFRLATAQGDAGTFAAVVCAVAPHQLDTLEARDDAVRLALTPACPPRHEPIYTAYLQYDQPVALPFPMLGRQQGLTQWFFDRQALGGQVGLIAAVISASGPQEDLDHAAVARQAHRELVEIVGSLPEPAWTKVIAERFATFACEPNVPRPDAATRVPGLVLAGDYTAGDYPATLEGAVRSGQRAAHLICNLPGTP